jgi:hypothetical protein
MSRTLSFAAIGLLAAFLTLSVPSVSHAQSYSYGYGTYPNESYSGYGYRSYGNFSYSGYGGYPGLGYSGYSGYGYGSWRPAIVHPEYLHWTPRRGWHTHGHVHVPHWGHYHYYRY